MSALMERLGLGGREMTASGHSKDFVLKVVQPSRLLVLRDVRTTRVIETLISDPLLGDGLP